MTNITWADCETTGLRPGQGDRLLEIAVLVTDKDLNILDEKGFHAIVEYDEEFVGIMAENADPFVRNMHATTGLWAKLYGSSALPIGQIDANLVKYLKRFGEPGTMPVGGNSVRLDMNFIDEYLPFTSAFLDYHMRDVSTVAGFAEDWVGKTNYMKRNDHTAMTDIRESIREMRFYRDTAFRPAAQPIELTAEMAGVLMIARAHEKGRIRSRQNGISSGVTYSRDERTRNIRKAVEMGVPLRQAQRFVFGSNLVPVEES